MEYNKKDLVDFAVTARKYKTLLNQKFINRKFMKHRTPTKYALIYLEQLSK
jgi:hypothetical protein